MYHKEVKDCSGKPLKVGDIVVIAYCSNPYIGIVHHFGRLTAVIHFKSNTGTHIWKGQKRPEYLLKLDLNINDYPELYNKLDEYGKTICKMS